MLRLLLRKGALFGALRERPEQLHPPLAANRSHEGLRLVGSVDDPSVRRWRRVDAPAHHYQETARKTLRALHASPALSMSRAQAGHPEVQQLAHHGLLTIHQEPLHHVAEFRAEITEKGREYTRKVLAEEGKARGQVGMFKGKALKNAPGLHLDPAKHRWVRAEDIRQGATFPTPLGDLRVKSADPDHVQVEHATGGHPVTMPRASAHHFFNDLTGSLAGHHPTSGNPHVDAVIAGRGEHLGKGNDGIVHRHGDHVVKVSTTVPYQPFNAGHRTPEGAAEHLQAEGNAHKALQGIRGVQEVQSIHHEGRTWLVKPHLDPAGKLSQAEADHIRDSVREMHGRGWSMNDEIQVGRHPRHGVQFMDLGQAHQAKGQHEIDRDEERLQDLYRQHGHTFHPVGEALRRAETSNRVLLHAAIKGGDHDKAAARFSQWKGHADARRYELSTAMFDTWEKQGEGHPDTLAAVSKADDFDATILATEDAHRAFQKTRPMRKGVRLMISLEALRKAQQLGLFGHAPPAPHIPGIVHVAGHVEHDKAGAHFVREHDRHIAIAAVPVAAPTLPSIAPATTTTKRGKEVPVIPRGEYKIVGYEDRRPIDFATGKRMPGDPDDAVSCHRCAKQHWRVFHVQGPHGGFKVGEVCAKQMLEGFDPTGEQFGDAIQRLQVEHENLMRSAANQKIAATYNTQAAAVHVRVAGVQPPPLRVEEKPWGSDRTARWFRYDDDNAQAGVPVVLKSASLIAEAPEQGEHQERELRAAPSRAMESWKDAVVTNAARAQAPTLDQELLRQLVYHRIRAVEHRPSDTPPQWERVLLKLRSAKPPPVPLTKGAPSRGLRFLVSLTALRKAIQVGLFGGERDTSRKPLAPRQVAQKAPRHVESTLNPPGTGWLPILGSKHGGFHRRDGAGWEYWYPGVGVTSPHAADKATIEDPKPLPMVRLIHPTTGEVTERTDFVQPSPTQPYHHMLGYEDGDRMGVGSSLAGRDGERWEVTGRETGDRYRAKITVRNTTTGEEKTGAAWELQNHFNETIHKDAIGARVTAARQEMDGRLRKGLGDLDAGRKELDAGPEAMVAVARRFQGLKELGSGLSWKGTDWAQALGVPTGFPKKWEGVAAEYGALADELRPRFIGSDWNSLLTEPANMIDVAMDAATLAKVARFHVLRQVVTDHGIGYQATYATFRDKHGAGPLSLSAGSVGDRMTKRPDGTYDPAAVIGALQVAMPKPYHRAWGEKTKRSDVKRIVVSHGYDLSINDSDKGKAADNLAKVRAIAQAAQESEGRFLFVENGHYDASDVNASDAVSRISYALEQLATTIGANPCPEIYGDHAPDAVTLDDVAMTILNPSKQQSRVASDTDEQFIVAAKATPADPIVSTYLPTGTMRTYKDGYSYPETAAVRAPLSVLVKAANVRAARSAAKFREEHRARVVTLKGHLAAVAEKVGDPRAHIPAAIEALADGQGMTGEPRAVAITAAWKAFEDVSKGEKHRSWAVAHNVYEAVHPDKYARRHQTGDDPARKRLADDPTKEEIQELHDHERVFRSTFKRAIADHVLAAIKASTGHQSDLEAARAAVHAVPPGTVVPGDKKQLKEGEPPSELLGYDLAADPGHLSTLLGWMSKDVIPHVDIGIKRGMGRAHCGYDNGIRLDRVTAHDDTLWHEYGHAIEHDNPDVTKMANTLRDHRGAGQKIKKLKDIDGRGYDDHEVTYEDEWDHKYIGKWYGHNGSTEVLSMGTEALMRDPLEMYVTDPEHFHFTVAALSGMMGAAGKTKHWSGKPPKEGAK